MLRSDLLFPARKERILVREKYSRSTHGFTPFEIDSLSPLAVFPPKIIYVSKRLEWAFSFVSS